VKLVEVAPTGRRRDKEDSMIHVGQTIENPVTGERLTFIETAASTGGEFVLVECAVAPNGVVAAAHVHPYQSERFEVVQGTLGIKIGRETIEAAAGEVVVVEPGTAHKFWNAGPEEARFVCEVRPALEFESLIETMFNLAADGKTNRKGMPNPFRLAVIARAHFDDVRLPFPPVFMQRAGLALGAPFGRALGFGATYEPATPEGDVAPAY
jgi:mannose-6-phosphate isomerase-like protein (cupin superfamily)